MEARLLRDEAGGGRRRGMSALGKSVGSWDEAVGSRGDAERGEVAKRGEATARDARLGDGRGEGEARGMPRRCRWRGRKGMARDAAAV